MHGQQPGLHCDLENYWAIENNALSFAPVFPILLQLQLSAQGERKEKPVNCIRINASTNRLWDARWAQTLTSQKMISILLYPRDLLFLSLDKIMLTLIKVNLMRINMVYRTPMFVFYICGPCMYYASVSCVVCSPVRLLYHVPIIFGWNRNTKRK